MYHFVGPYSLSYIRGKNVLLLLVINQVLECISYNFLCLKRDCGRAPDFLARSFTKLAWHNVMADDWTICWWWTGQQCPDHITKVLGTLGEEMSVNPLENLTPSSLWLPREEAGFYPLEQITPSSTLLSCQVNHDFEVERPPNLTQSLQHCVPFMVALTWKVSRSMHCLGISASLTRALLVGMPH